MEELKSGMVSREEMERNLQQQLSDTQLQLKRVTEERDRYWQALSNRG